MLAKYFAFQHFMLTENPKNRSTNVRENVKDHIHFVRLYYVRLLRKKNRQYKQQYVILVCIGKLKKIMLYYFARNLKKETRNEVKNE